MRYFYTLIFYCAVPFIFLRLAWRAIKAPAYARRWSERFGFVAPLENSCSSAQQQKIVWLHTVSVGEFIAAIPLAQALLKRADIRLVITTTTPTGSERVRAQFGDSVYHVYAPYDLPDVLARFLRRVRPTLLLIMETELWPNTLAACAARKIPSVLVNARMSARSAQGYQKFSALTRPMLNDLTLALVQNKTDAVRFETLGLAAEKLSVTGSIKFDLDLSDELRVRAAQLKNALSLQGKRRVLIAASTHQGEDEIILDAFAHIKKNNSLSSCFLILVPRHPERFAAVFELSKARGFSVAKRSSQDDCAACDILVGDTMGELLLLYGASDIAFIGGSLVPRGGHNFIEAAAWGLPLLSGPHIFNFAQIGNLMQEAGALQLVATASELAQEVEFLLSNADEYQTACVAALRVAEENRGAIVRVLTAIDELL